MEKRSSWKWAILAVLVAMSVLLVSFPLDKPLQQKIPLGLDLRGGLSLVLAIDEEALVEEFREAAGAGLSPEELDVRVKDALKDARSRALQVISNRVNARGTREPIILPEKGSNRIIVQIPGASEEERRKIEEELQQVAFLSFHLVHDGNEELTDELFDRGFVPVGFRLTEMDGKPYYVRDWAAGVEVDFRTLFVDAKAPVGFKYLLQRRYLQEYDLEVYAPCCVKRRSEFTGRTLKDATGELSPLGQRYVSLKFNSKGARIFERVTEDHGPRGLRNADSDIGRQLAISLDDVVFSAPVIRHVIRGGSAQIDGHFPGNEADRLAQVLRTGALPAPVKIVEKRTVDPSLGADSIRSGVRSIVLGGVLVAVFMVVYYLLSGFIADLALVLNLILLPLGMVVVAGFLGIFAGTTLGDNAFELPVLTLPGIAGILLAIGMAVDANVLIFERIREEFKTGKRLWPAITAGYDRAFVTILDANVTTFLTGVVLFFCGGSGPIRGFSVTLCAGILVSMFTALVVTRLLFDLMVHKMNLKSLPMLTLIGDTKINFVDKRHIAAAASLLLIAATWAVLVVRGMESRSNVLGVDFTGGSAVTFDFSSRRPVEEVRDTLHAAGVGDVQIQYQRELDGSSERLVVKAASEFGDTVKSALVQKFAADAYTAVEEVKVDSQVGEELTKRAILSIVVALVLMIVYVSWRFEFGFALGAIVALAHDVLVTVGVYSLLGRQVSLPIVAALLTIVGYSINDTIVVFDRIREDLRMFRNKSFKEICNLSINQTLGRTLLTSLTTLITVVMLLVFGGGAINDFALALCIGVVVGTYSSIFVATPVVLLWHRNRKPEFALK